MKKIISLLLSSLLLLSLSLSLLSCAGASQYEKSKKESLAYITENEADLVELFDALIAEAKPHIGDKGFLNGAYHDEYDGKTYSYSVRSDTEFIVFEMNADESEAKRFISIIYCPANNYIRDGEDTEIIKENDTVPDGKAVWVTEKLKDGWYFYYIDYEGVIDTEKDIK